MSQRPRILRVIARLNVGGPARHVLLATQRLAPWYDTTLAVGSVEAGEREASAWIAEHGVTPVRIPGLGRAISPIADLRAYRALRRLLRETKPHILHTHTAKAGFLARLAVRGMTDVRVVHTFHGHVFEGYFGRAASRLHVCAERRLARRTDVVVAVSDEVASDLVERWRIAPREKVKVVPVGIPLEPFLAAEALRGRLRAELGIGGGVPVVAWIGRLVPVKQVALALAVHRRVCASHPDAVLVVAGDGPERVAGDANVRFLGWRDDVATILADADVALLTSRNEGTPVSLIEAGAAGVPAVATRVGGVPSVVEDGVTGLLAQPDAEALARLVAELLADPERRRRMGSAARERVRARFSAERMIEDMRALYATVQVR